MKNLKALLPVLALTMSLTGSKAITFTSDTTIGAGDTTYDGQEIVVSNCTLTVDGGHSFTSLWLADSAVLTHSPAPAGEANNRLDLAIVGAMTIDATSRVDVNAKGYGPAAGPGAGGSAYDEAAGGGHGGPGGNAYGGLAGDASYGELLAPTVWGSGGGSMENGGSRGGAGGGWVRLHVGGVLTVAGQLTANGESVWASGGAGGSIQVTAGTLAGNGRITANGGSAGHAESGGGGGGRIALYYGSSTFSVGLAALGGLSSAESSGGAGTLYTKATSQSAGDLLLDNSGRTNAMETPITAPVAYRLTLTNATAYTTEPLTLSSLRIGTNGLLTHPPAQLTGLNLAVAGDVTIDAGGGISADCKGYGSAAGPGAGINDYYNPSGGGYGGQGGSAYGGIAGGASYGDLLAPTQCGSGGGNGPWHNPPTGGAGGGVIRLDVGGVLTVGGQLTANGESMVASGGAGGSIYVRAGTLAGNGRITANGGGAGYYLSGGGGGGRIALYYGNSTFSGGLAAFGGLSTGANSGAAGTLYTKASSQSVGDLLLDNSGRTNGMETLITAPVAYRLTLTNATAYATNSLTLSSLRVSANGLLTHPFQGPRLQVLVQGNALVEGGGAVAADTRGFPAETGPGHGSWLGGYYGQGTGAGHGGQGGACYSGGPGGMTYDSETEPVELGSGGGGGGAIRGGGAIQLTVTGTLTIDGRVSVNADAVTGGYSGGGAGGSVWLTASRLNGTGSITANGQLCGYFLAGSGGGGRLAIYAGVNQFTGSIQANGALGGYASAAGTVHYGPNAPAGLISWWRGEGNTSDTMDVHPGTPLGGLSYAAGQIGQAFVFNGQNAAVALGNWFNLQEFTLSLWVKPDASQVPNADILDNNHTGAKSWVIQSANNATSTTNQWIWGGNGAGGIYYWMTNSAWQQIVVTVSSNHVSHLYRNGQLLQTVTGTGPIMYDGTQYFNLGKHQLLGRYFNGWVDELMCFNRPLLPEEVASLYFNQGGPLQLSIQPAAGGVLLSWPAIATSYGLVCRTNLTAGAWESVTNTPVLNGDRQEVLLPANTPVQRFFGLQPNN
jgi:hypothetical protein